MVDVGFKPTTTQKTHGLSATPFVTELVRYFRLITCKRFTNSLPKLSLTAIGRIRRSIPCNRSWQYEIRTVYRRVCALVVVRLN